MPPLSPDRSLASAADHAACRTMLAGGSKTFMLASCFLPWRVRDPSIALYAFCRQADDAVDLGGDEGALDALCRRLDAIYAGAPLDSPADRAFADAVAQFSIPMSLPLALLDGFRWDLEGRRYETVTGLEAYGARVAGAVGAMMALVMGASDVRALARACDLGVAMQLTNIARDVGEDARMGRLYLPLEWMARENIDVERFLAEPSCSPGLRRVVQRLLQRAEDFYASADLGIEGLPTPCRPSIRAARRLYAEIGRQVEANDFDSVSRRAIVPTGRKLAIAAGALTAASPAVPSGPVLAGAEFLLGPAQQQPQSTKAAVDWTMADRLLWTAGLMQRQRARKLRRPSPPAARFREPAPWTGADSLATNG